MDRLKAVDLDRVSRDLFGRPCRLPLALWILDRDKRFFQSEPPREVASQTAVRQELDRFVSMGLLAKYQPDGENRIYYDMTDSPWWDVVRAARDVVHREEAGSP